MAEEKLDKAEIWNALDQLTSVSTKIQTVQASQSQSLSTVVESVKTLSDDVRLLSNKYNEGRKANWPMYLGSMSLLISVVVAVSGFAATVGNMTIKSIRADIVRIEKRLDNDEVTATRIREYSLEGNARQDERIRTLERATLDSKGEQDD